MKSKLTRYWEPLGYVAVALVAVGSLVAVAGDGLCPLKTASADAGAACDAKAAKAGCEGGVCPSSLAKAEKASGCCAKDAKTAKAEGAACATDAKTAKAEGGCATKAGHAVAEGGVCPLTGKKLAEGAACEKGACPDKNIVGAAIQDGSFSTFILAARAAGMMDKLNCPEPKTVLAPTNEAFQKLPTEQWAALLQDDEALRAVLSRHIIAGAIPAAEMKTAKAESGAELCAKHCNVSGKTTIGTASVVKADIVASNGLIHGIDNVLLPEAPADVAAAPAPAEAESVQVASAE
ncbi:MAG: fasciclin domain-containing protein [Candidatus Hydrogenedentes bacterium]|nr:fasciclin domain-containing protein [Candidatus Hydrogenedentota bacterium]